MFSCTNEDEGIKLPLQNSLAILYGVESTFNPWTLHIPKAVPGLLFHYLELFMSVPRGNYIGGGR